MKATPITTENNLQFDPNFCHLQNNCKVNSLISIKKMPNSKMQISNCKNLLQFEIPHNKTTRYDSFQIADWVYHTFGMGWCVNCASLFAHHLMFVFVVASEMV